jgi:uncharacterized protein YpmB
MEGITEGKNSDAVIIAMIVFNIVLALIQFIKTEMHNVRTAKEKAERRADKAQRTTNVRPLTASSVTVKKDE